MGLSGLMTRHKSRLQVYLVFFGDQDGVMWLSPVIDGFVHAVAGKSYIKKDRESTEWEQYTAQYELIWIFCIVD